MTLRSVASLGLVLLATPLIFTGCGDNNDKKPDGSPIVVDGGTTIDAPAARLDGKPASDVPLAPDVPATPDGPEAQDALPASDAQDAPLAPDAPAADAGQGDATSASDGLSDCTEPFKFVGGEVTTSTTLTKACSPYTISASILVNGNATLTIEPGVALRFNPDTAIDIGRNSAGKLSAIGTAAAPHPLHFRQHFAGSGRLDRRSALGKHHERHQI